MAAIPDSIEIKLKVDTTDLEEAIAKCKMLNELIGDLPDGLLATGSIDALKQLGIIVTEEALSKFKANECYRGE